MYSKIKVDKVFRDIFSKEVEIRSDHLFLFIPFFLELIGPELSNDTAFEIISWDFFVSITLAIFNIIRAADIAITPPLLFFNVSFHNYSLFFNIRILQIV